MRLFLSSLAFCASLAAATAAPASEGAGKMTPTGAWKIIKIAGVDQLDSAKTEFQFLPERRLAATLGCNRMIGGVELKGDTLKLGPVAMTQMACPPPLDQDEHVLVTALEAVRQFTLHDETLKLRDQTGAEVITLQRRK